MEAASADAGMGATPGEPAVLKHGRMEIHGGQPIKFVETDVELRLTIPADQREEASSAGKAIKGYRTAAKELLAGRYKELRALAPAFLREPCAVSVVCCSDGLIVRYDRTSDAEPKVRSGAVNEPLSKVAPAFSDGLIHFPQDANTYNPGEGVQIELAKFDVTTGQALQSAAFRPLVYASLTVPENVQLPAAPHRPTPLISMTNQVEVAMEGEIVEAEPALNAVERATPFVSRSQLELPVGWLALEFYPRLGAPRWNPQFAPLWAETDLLAAVAREQFRSAQFASLDPNVDARKNFLRVVAEFESLLSGPEEPAHQFLKSHPELLNLTHVAFWSKLPLGDRVTDFVFKSPTQEYLLVEIESPLRELFRKDGHPRAELTHAISQIIDWRVFIENNLGKVQTELGLVGMPANPESLIVIGRASALNPENRRKLATLHGQVPNLKILTYDDLIADVKASAENLFGPLGLTGTNVEFYLMPAKEKKKGQH